MGWKRLFIFLTVVLVLAGGGHIMEVIHGVGSSAKTAATALTGTGSSVGRGIGTTAASGNGSASVKSTGTGTGSAGSVGGTGRAGSIGTSTGGTNQGSTPSDPLQNTSFDPAIPHDAPIPKDSLRLRIIANSDSAKDQQVKREVRDVIVLQVAKLVGNAKTEKQAQEIVTKHMQELQALAQTVVQKQGFSYDVKANVGMVPFPTKVYGNRVYPAGNYEALRLILGKGQGHNWWCVLFPPLCFVDIADGDAVPNTGGFPDLPPLEVLTVKNMEGKPTKVQVRLASLDYGEELWKTIRKWF